VRVGRQVVSKNDECSDVEFLNDLGYCLPRVQEQDGNHMDFDEAESYLSRVLNCIKHSEDKDHEDYLRLIANDSLGYVRTLSGTRSRNGDKLKKAVRLGRRRGAPAGCTDQATGSFAHSGRAYVGCSVSYE
jgi:hypothetical protein